jgi:exosortase
VEDTTLKSSDTTRWFRFLGFVALSSAIFHRPLAQLFSLAFSDELYSHIPLIPLASIFFLFVERRRIFARPRHLWAGGGAVAGLGLAIALIGRLTLQSRLAAGDLLSLLIFSLVVVWIGGFLIFFGGRAFRNGAFPLLFLFFMVPIPSFLLDLVVPFLQWASAHLTDLFFSVLGLPHLRNGMAFDLPGISIEVARECSGIRSTIALAITLVVASRIFLRTPWARVLLVASVVPFAIIKNAIRITTLSLLAVHVDPSFITGSDLHRRGGIVFFSLTLLLVGAWVLCLRWMEGRSHER